MRAIAQTVGRPRTQLAFEAVATESSTFLFADIAGFTALTEAHGAEHAVAPVHHVADAAKHALPPAAAEYRRAARDLCGLPGSEGRRRARRRSRLPDGGRSGQGRGSAHPRVQCLLLLLAHVRGRVRADP